MRARLSGLSLIVMLALSLAACAQVSRQTSATAADVNDDDAHCRNRGAPGTDAYAQCLKNRDVMREQSQARRDRTHRRVADDMLNGR